MSLGRPDASCSRYLRAVTPSRTHDGYDEGAGHFWHRPPTVVVTPAHRARGEGAVDERSTGSTAHSFATAAAPPAPPTTRSCRCASGCRGHAPLAGSAGVGGLVYGAILGARVARPPAGREEAVGAIAVNRCRHAPPRPVLPGIAPRDERHLPERPRVALIGSVFAKRRHPPAASPQVRPIVAESMGGPVSRLRMTSTTVPEMHRSPGGERASRRRIHVRHPSGAARAHPPGRPR